MTQKPGPTRTTTRKLRRSLFDEGFRMGAQQAFACTYRGARGAKLRGVGLKKNAEILVISREYSTKLESISPPKSFRNAPLFLFDSYHFCSSLLQPSAHCSRGSIVGTELASLRDRVSRKFQVVPRLVNRSLYTSGTRHSWHQLYLLSQTRNSHTDISEIKSVVKTEIQGEERGKKLRQKLRAEPGIEPGTTPSRTYGGVGGFQPEGSIILLDHPADRPSCGYGVTQSVHPQFGDFAHSAPPRGTLQRALILHHVIRLHYIGCPISISHRIYPSFWMRKPSSPRRRGRRNPQMYCARGGSLEASNPTVVPGQARTPAVEPLDPSPTRFGTGVRSGRDAAWTGPILRVQIKFNPHNAHMDREIFDPKATIQIHSQTELCRRESVASVYNPQNARSRWRREEGGSRARDDSVKLSGVCLEICVRLRMEGSLGCGFGVEGTPAEKQSPTRTAGGNQEVTVCECAVGWEEHRNLWAPQTRGATSVYNVRKGSSEAAQMLYTGEVDILALYMN
ncbi:hypothetical protein K438DRAFT_1759416 [Mycena galopus ATCC 62051]|nr:hypothetical protein K438DRAFT_1759416 [Mycena galopus ATCC 62051]